MIFGIYLHYKKILRMWKPYCIRAGRREEGKKKRKMNIILYYIILYIILYIYVFINILTLFANRRGVFAERFFFFWLPVLRAVSPPSPPLTLHPLHLLQISLTLQTMLKTLLKSTTYQNFLLTNENDCCSPSKKL